MSTRPGDDAGPGREAGDRAAFLAPARARLAGGIAVNPVHPPPPPRRTGDPVPFPRYRNLDPDDLVGTFAAAVAHAEARVPRRRRRRARRRCSTAWWASWASGPW